MPLRFENVVFLICFLFFSTAFPLDGHGIGGSTFVAVYSDVRHMYQIHQMRQRDDVYVCSYDVATRRSGFERVKESREHKTNCYFKIGFDGNDANGITCTPTQKFYVPIKNQWISAWQLRIGDELLTSRNSVIPISHIEFVEQPLVVYVLEVENTHIFCVSRFSIVTHNVLIPAASIGLGVAFGSGAAAGAAAGSFFGPITLIGGFTLGGLIALGIKAYRSEQKDIHYDLEFNTTAINAIANDQGMYRIDKNGAQAPGLPTKEVGYKEPKKWNGEKVRHPHTGQVGYPDRNGNIWVPTGPGSGAHGGPHWDVVPPGKKKKHVNVYPNGKIR